MPTKIVINGSGWIGPLSSNLIIQSDQVINVYLVGIDIDYLVRLVAKL